jgi:hypothetical protein
MSRVGRRSVFACASLALAVALWVSDAVSQTLQVPIRLQAELLSKVAAYDRSFSQRSGGRALVLILVRDSDAESIRVGEQIQAELAVLARVGGLQHAEEFVHFSSAQALAELCRKRAPAILYISLGLADQMEGIAHALEGVSILSVAASASYVPKRAVLSFDAESGRPKLVVNLGQARRQSVAFQPELLALARVIP